VRQRRTPGTSTTDRNPHQINFYLTKKSCGAVFEHRVVGPVAVEDSVQFTAGSHDVVGCGDVDPPPDRCGNAGGCG
jgi:hypothetical protein